MNSRDDVRLRTTRRSRGGAARGGGTPSSTSKAGWSGSGRQWRTWREQKVCRRQPNWNKIVDGCVSHSHQRHQAQRACTLPLHTQAAQGDCACVCVRACVRGFTAHAEVPVEPQQTRGHGQKRQQRGRRRRIRGQDGMPVAFRPFPRAEQGSGEQAAVEGAGGRRTPPRRGRAPFPRCPLVP